MPETTAFDIVTVGHFVVDTIVPMRKAQPRTSLGGPATFVSLAASNLGARVGVVSRVGKDFHRKLGWLRQKNVDVSHVRIVENALTTSFVLSYSDKGRKLQIRRRAPQIELVDIPASLRAKAIHVAPVAGELPARIIPRLREKAQVLSIDPQGFLRRFDKAGRARPKTPVDTGFLRYCDIFKSSLQEIRVFAGSSKLVTCTNDVRRHGVRTILVTMGRKGALAYLEDGVYHVPACKPRVFKDSTGAGDAFMGGFLAEYVRNRDPLWCCCVGSAAASFVVEGMGSARFGRRSEVYERATEIYEKGVKPVP